MKSSTASYYGLLMLCVARWVFFSLESTVIDVKNFLFFVATYGNYY